MKTEISRMAVVIRLAATLLTLNLMSASVPAHRASTQGAKPPQPVQTPAPKEIPPRQEDVEDEVVRITTNLIQVDAVVTDARGKRVTDLSAEDFEIVEDGGRREITNFSYIIHGAPLGAAKPPTTGSALSSRVSPARLRPEQLRRTIVLVVDDLTMSHESAVYTRRAMRRFIEEQMESGDLVAVARVSAGVGALQQLTADKAQLNAAVGRVRGMNKCDNSSFAFIPQASTPDGGGGSTTGAMVGPNNPDAQSINFGDQVFVTGVLGAVNLIVRGLREMPGRKAVVLFSEGRMDCNDPATFGPEYGDRLKRISDMANRASVVIYSVDPRGLIAFDSDPTAAPKPTTNPAASAQRLREQSSFIFNSQRAWMPLVEPTGGFSVYNSNDLPGALQRIAEDQQGYYLIGYRPAESTFKGDRSEPRYRNLTVRVKRPGLKVRARQGFYNLTDESARPATPRTSREQLLAALSSPFSSGQIDVRLTSLFGNEAEGSFVLSMLHIDPRGLTFAEQPDGWSQAVLDVLAMTFDADGKIVEQVGRTQTIRARGETFRKIMKNGLVYSLSVPAKKPGGYQLRIAVRDAASERVGSAGQFVEVPDIGAGRLVLSGVIVQAATAGADATAPDDKAAASDAATPEYDPAGGPALRRFRRNDLLEYGYTIYNPRLDKSTGRPRLRTRIILFHDGRQVYAGQSQPLEITGNRDTSRYDDGGRLQFDAALQPGEYVLQVVVTDELAGEQRRTAVQTIDFEIID